METAELQLMSELLDRTPVLALAVLVDERPFVGQLPFAPWAERRSLLVHVSSLARHSRGLTEGAPFGALVGGSGLGKTDPFRIPRISFEGQVRRLERERDEYREAAEIYLRRLPTGRGHFALGDFSLVELAVERGRFVAGFGRAYTVTAEHLAQAVELWT